jgi:hypothetical protein
LRALQCEYHDEKKHVLATTSLSDKQKAAILGGGSAARLFGIEEA